MSKYKMLGVIGSALLIIGVFFSFIKIQAFGITVQTSLIKGWKGWLILLIGILNLIIIFFDELKVKFSAIEKLTKIKNNKYIAIISGVALAIVVITTIRVKASEGGAYASLTLGFWATFIGGILGIISGVKTTEE